MCRDCCEMQLPTVLVDELCCMLLHFLEEFDVKLGPMLFECVHMDHRVPLLPGCRAWCRNLRVEVTRQLRMPRLDTQIILRAAP